RRVMRHRSRFSVLLAALAAAVVIASVFVPAQTGTPAASKPATAASKPAPAAAKAAPAAKATRAWAAKKTPWGDPDLQGVWNDATSTPLQRPAGKGETVSGNEANLFEEQ